MVGCCHGREDDLLVCFGWASYGLGTRGIGAVIFTVAPLLLTSAARAQVRRERLKPVC